MRPLLFVLLFASATMLHAADDISLATPPEIESIRNGMSDTLLDPGSAEYKNVNVSGGLVCGQVNAKNTVGGYVGFRFFMAALADDRTASGKATIVNIDQPGAPIAEDICRGRGLIAE